MTKLRVEYTVPAPGECDMDWTEPFLELGTTFSLTGSMETNVPIQVEEAYVKDEKLYVWGYVEYDGENK